MRPVDMEPLIGHQVIVTYVDGYQENAFLRGAEPPNVVLMRYGKRYSVMPEDIEHLEPNPPPPTLSVPDVPAGACGADNRTGDARCLSRKGHGGTHLYMREIGN